MNHFPSRSAPVCYQFDHDVVDIAHDDVIKWKHFPRYWSFERGNSPVTGEFPAQWLVTRGLNIFFDLRQNKWLSKQSRRRWFDTPSRSLWRHCSMNFNPILTLVTWPVRGRLAAIPLICSKPNCDFRLNHCNLVTPYGDMDLGQHWLSNELLRGGTKPLLVPMLANHQWGPKAFIWEQFHKKI